MLEVGVQNDGMSTRRSASYLHQRFFESAAGSPSSRVGGKEAIDGWSGPSGVADLYSFGFNSLLPEASPLREVRPAAPNVDRVLWIRFPSKHDSPLTDTDPHLHSLSFSPCPSISRKISTSPLPRSAGWASGMLATYVR